MASSDQTIPRLKSTRLGGLFFIFALLSIQTLSLPFGQAQEADGATSPPVSVLTYLEPYRSLEMSPAESGVIREILVKEGDHVLKGQPLLKLDAETIEARLATAMAQADNIGGVLAAESQHKLEKDRYEKLQSLGGQASKYERDRQLAEMKGAEGRLTEALEQKRVFQLQADQARAELERRILKSPIDGIVVEIVKDLAEPVSPIESSRDEYLIRIVRVDQLRAEAFLPGHWADQIQEGDSMTLRIPAKKENEPDKVVKGIVEFISPVNDSASNTVRLKLVIDNANGAIRAGTAAQLELGPEDDVDAKRGQ